MKPKLKICHWRRSAMITFAIIIASSLGLVQAETLTDNDTKPKQQIQVKWERDNKLVLTQVGVDGSSEEREVMTIDISDITKNMDIFDNDTSDMKISEQAALSLFNKLVENGLLSKTVTDGTNSNISISYDDFLAMESKIEAAKRTAEDGEGDAKVEKVSLYEKDCQLIKFYEPQKYSGTYYTFVIRHKEYTQVDMVTNVRWDGHWRSLNSAAYLLNILNGDKYMLHSTIGDYPTDKTLVFRKLKGKTTVITRIFPPLDKDVKMVTLVDVYNPDIVYPQNSTTENPHNWNLKVYDSVEDLPYYLEVEGKVITLDADFKLPSNDPKLYK